jgi:hypothetical protein
MFVGTFGGVVYQVSEFNITPGGSITQRGKNDLSGIDYSSITGMEPRVTLKMIKLDTGNNINEKAEDNSTNVFTLIGNAAFGGAYDVTVNGISILDLTNDDADGFECWSFEGTVSSVDLMPKAV